MKWEGNFSILYTVVPSTHLLHPESFLIKIELSIMIPKIYPLILGLLGNLSGIPIRGLITKIFSVWTVFYRPIMPELYLNQK